VTTKLLNTVLSLVRPTFEAAKSYNRLALQRDAVAGLTVAVIAVPQSMAYALVAGVPMAHGLYTVIVQCFVASLFNSQRFLSVGPINTQSLLVASIVTRLVEPGDSALYLHLVIGLTLIKGLMQLAMSLVRLGGLARYMSHSAIVGFTAGAGVLIAAGQVHWLLGFPVFNSPGDWPGIVGDVQRLWPHLDQTSIWSIGIGLMCLAVMCSVRRLSPIAPGPLIAVGGSAVAVVAIGLTSADLPLCEQLPNAGELFKAFHLPRLDWSQADALLAGALALSLVGLAEAYSIGKTIAGKTGEQISANRELFSQGLANTVSSFFQCIPGSGSFSRSALNYKAGAKTRFAGVFNSLFVAVIFMVFAPTAQYVPMAALAAVLFVIAYSLIDFRYINRARKSNRADTAVCLGTFLAMLFVPLVYAVFVGVFLNLALHLYRASRLHIVEMVRSEPTGPFEERPISDGNHGKPIMFLQVEGELFFGVADELQNQLTRLAASGVKVMVFRLRRALGIDATVMNVLEQFTRQMQSRGGHVILCGVKSDLIQDMRSFGLLDTIGESNVFETGAAIFGSAQRALDRADELITPQPSPGIPVILTAEQMPDEHRIPSRRPR